MGATEAVVGATTTIDAATTISATTVASTEILAILQTTMTMGVDFNLRVSMLPRMVLCHCCIHEDVAVSLC